METQEKETQRSSSKAFQFVSFKVGEETYGVNIDGVQEIVRMPEITHLPQTESFLRGVINLRGNIIPVIDMRERFGIESKVYNNLTRVIVVKIKEKLIGMIVDTVSQVVVLAQDDIEDAPDIIHGISKEYLDGIGKIQDELIIILNSEKILSTEEILKIEKAKDSNLPRNYKAE